MFGEIKLLEQCAIGGWIAVDDGPIEVSTKIGGDFIADGGVGIDFVELWGRLAHVVQPFYRFLELEQA